jgi:dolichyl-diphosphooligosaccharide--protein glycosyltransferase/undecaprenyl-diphosphooligosaccharide--protein glycosyltransferase
MNISDNKKILLFILTAFTFSFLVRLIWVVQFQDIEQFKFNDQFMINTNDGYYFAEGARDILSGEHQTNDLSPVHNATSKLTAFLADILPFSLETIIFYLPAVLSSLVVIPVILIGKTLNNIQAGFIAALVASIAWSYYNRTMVGYYDTDMLNIVFPTFLLWSLIWAIQTHEDKYIIFTTLIIVTNIWWYNASYALVFAFLILVLSYAIYQYIKKENYKYSLALASFMMLAMMDISLVVKLVIIASLLASLHLKKDIFLRYIFYILVASVALFAVNGGVDIILSRLEGYVFKNAVSNVKEGLGLHFFSVMQTIREANAIPFERFASRISGHTAVFIFSIIGYILLVIKHRIMLLALPMVGLGFLAYGIPGVINGAGLRFTIYAVPIMALGLGYLIVYFSSKISEKNKYYLISTFTLLALFPNINHILGYKIPTVFINKEVQTLDKLKKIASREDYVVTWWDYGYPIRYYSDVKTLIDGGKHAGDVNFPVSFILTKPQEVAAKMARLEVEYTERKFQLQEQNKTKKLPSNTEQMTLDYGLEDTNDFLSLLETSINLPQKTRDIYLYLPRKLLSIIPTVTLFSNLDLMSGQTQRKPFFLVSRHIKQSKNAIDLGNGTFFLKDKGQVKIGQRVFNINKLALTSYNKDLKLKKQVQTINQNSPINLIYMRDYGIILLLDEAMYNSTFIQLFVLENYDKDLFEPVLKDPFSKVYKLKI